ncbi:TetR/AcrR family transcriptional regulator [Actinacidiphila alni]|uniref:TetR/AcrR family transcriptional regulator n=1 Tax=Actinacidiphila alni TaxID=380248 RepID=UPI0033E64489
MTRRPDPLHAQDGGAPTRRLSAAKREAIVRGARTVFGREGFPRAGIDAIAVEAGVSTRTIYNHFRDKEQLFATVIEESSAHVGDALTALIDRHLEAVPASGLESALIALGHDWVAVMTECAEHFALVRQITAEAAHLPPALLDLWQESGPRPARAALVHRFRLLAAAGALDAPDPARAATHFHLLAFAEITDRTHLGATPLPPAEISAIITAGVHTFLHGHAPTPTRPPVLGTTR